MNTTQKIVLFSGLGLGAVAIAAYFSRQMRLLDQACYAVAGAMIHHISATNVSFTLLLNVKNKSDISYTITNQKYNIYVNGMLVAKVENPEDVEIAGKAKNTFKVDVNFNPQDLLKFGIQNINALLYDKEKLVIELKGNFKMKSGIVVVNNYKVDERLTMKELLAPYPPEYNC